MTTPKHIKKTLLMIAPEHIYYCKSNSSLIALYKRIENYQWAAEAKGKLYGYLNCLVVMGIISKDERCLLYEWFSTEDRSKEEL